MADIHDQHMEPTFSRWPTLAIAFENRCILTAVGVLAILINTTFITYVGRRRAFLTAGLVFCGFSQLIVAVIYTVHPGTESTSKAIVGLSVVFILGYSVSVPNLLEIENICKLNSDISCVLGNDIDLFVGVRGRVTVLATSIVHIRACGCSCILGCCKCPITPSVLGFSRIKLILLDQWLTIFTAPYFINPDSLNWG